MYFFFHASPTDIDDFHQDFSSQRNFGDENDNHVHYGCSLTQEGALGFSSSYMAEDTETEGFHQLTLFHVSCKYHTAVTPQLLLSSQMKPNVLTMKKHIYLANPHLFLQAHHPCDSCN